MHRQAACLLSLLMTTALDASARDATPTPDSPGLWCFAPENRPRQASLERTLNALVDPANLRGYHERLAAEPHRAGTEGDLRLIEYMAEEFEGMGLDVEVQWLSVYLAEPVSASVKVVGPVEMQLSVTEPAIEGDRYTADTNLDIAWNAYSGSGVVRGGVVYANYGRLEDFQTLKELGVDCTGKIVVARYGGNFRGTRPSTPRKPARSG